MQLNSISFIVFLCAIAFINYKINSKFSAYIISIANIIFYFLGGSEYIPILFFISISSYISALYIEKRQENNKKYHIFLLSFIILFSLLFFKYYNFFIEIINSIATIFNLSTSFSSHSLVWPLGISFYTFTALGYVFDVALKKHSANKNFIEHFAFVSFFTTVSSGPILRYSDFNKELKKEKVYNFNNIQEGILRIFLGAFKKLVIADNIGKIVDNTYSNIENFNSPIILLAIILYAIQIYADFSGYSDMAIGASKVLNFNIIENFKRPYLAKTYSDFWARWHISLTSWFRDYIFIPLSFTFPKLGLFSIFIIYPISGLWHGAGWNFIIWGTLNGLFMIIGKETIKKRRKLHKKIPLYKNDILKHIIQSSIVFSLFSFTLIFFRLQNLSFAFSVIVGVFNNWSSLFDFSYMITSLKAVGIGSLTGILLIIYILLLAINDLIEEKYKTHISKLILSLSSIKKISLIYILAIIFILFANTAASSYIYYQF